MIPLKNRVIKKSAVNFRGEKAMPKRPLATATLFVINLGITIWGQYDPNLIFIILEKPIILSGVNG
jgi:hypothetical protein